MLDLVKLDTFLRISALARRSRDANQQLEDNLRLVQNS